MIVYSEFVPDVNARYQVGWVNIGLVLGMVLVNILTISASQLKEYIWKLRMKMLRDNQKKETRRR